MRAENHEACALRLVEQDVYRVALDRCPLGHYARMVGLEQVKRVRDELPGQLPGFLGAVIRADGPHWSVSQFSFCGRPPQGRMHSVRVVRSHHDRMLCSLHRDLLGNDDLRNTVPPRWARRHHPRWMTAAPDALVAGHDVYRPAGMSDPRDRGLRAGGQYQDCSTGIGVEQSARDDLA